MRLRRNGRSGTPRRGKQQLPLCAKAWHRQWGSGELDGRLQRGIWNVVALSQYCMHASPHGMVLGGAARYTVQCVRSVVVRQAGRLVVLSLLISLVPTECELHTVLNDLGANLFASRRNTCSRWAASERLGGISDRPICPTTGKSFGPQFAMSDMGS